MGLNGRRWLGWGAAGLAGLVLAAAATQSLAPRTWKSLMTKSESPRAQAPSPASDLPALFAGKGCPYPPKRLAMVAIKDEKRLELWAPGADGTWKLLKEYPILAASGHAGPKLREGDRQVPEGVYEVVLLNPRSNYHLSLKLDYPNEFDREMARSDGRTDLGGDIFIHGEKASIGCLAVGNPAIEEIFALVKETGKERVKVLIAPWDFRKAGVTAAPPPGAPRWVPRLYERLRGELAAYPRKQD